MGRESQTRPDGAASTHRSAEAALTRRTCDRGLIRQVTGRPLTKSATGGAHRRDREIRSRKPQGARVSDPWRASTHVGRPRRPEGFTSASGQDCRPHQPTGTATHARPTASNGPHEHGSRRQPGGGMKGLCPGNSDLLASTDVNRGPDRHGSEVRGSQAGCCRSACQTATAADAVPPDGTVVRMTPLGCLWTTLENT